MAPDVAPSRRAEAVVEGREALGRVQPLGPLPPAAGRVVVDDLLVEEAVVVRGRGEHESLDAEQAGQHHEQAVPGGPGVGAVAAPVAADVAAAAAVAAGPHGADAREPVEPEGPRVRDVVGDAPRVGREGAVGAPDLGPPGVPDALDVAVAWQQKGDSTSLQRGCSATKTNVHASRPFREMITRPKISQNEWKTTEI